MTAEKSVACHVSHVLEGINRRWNIRLFYERVFISIAQSINTANRRKKNPISPLWQAVVYPEGVDISVGKACRFDSTDGASG